MSSTLLQYHQFLFNKQIVTFFMYREVGRVISLLYIVCSMFKKISHSQDHYILGRAKIKEAPQLSVERLLKQ